MTYHIITLFPDSLTSYFNESILKRAQEDKKIGIKFYNPRDYTNGTSYADRRVDDKPYGGGPGMVIEALPIIKAIEDAKSKSKKAKIILNTQISFLSVDDMKVSMLVLKKHLR
jgi:tRNA (guanine37-N1)-methyltransferase